MNRSHQAELARRFRDLHHGRTPLVLPNAWDAASARLVEQAGFAAVATTSAGVAWALGVPDGEVLTRDDMLAAVARIARAVALPVTADLEAGYGPRPEDAAATARGAIEAGAVGMNFEDATGDAAHPLFDVAAQVERITAARAAADALGVHLVINARTDVYLAAVGAPDTRLAETVRRLGAYRDAGACCLFAPGVSDPGIIATLVRELRAPLNVLARPGMPTVAELARMGVARVSVGGALMRAALAHTRDLLGALHQTGDLSAIAGAALSHADLQALMAPERQGRR